MHGLILTKHFNERLQQRGLKDTVIDVLIQYGEQRPCRYGVISIRFTKVTLAEIKADYDSTIFRACERFRNTYIIMSEDGVLITVARSFRRTVH